jgi:hypothetical protein
LRANNATTASGERCRLGGFHDYSHFSHADKPMFGFNPGMAMTGRHFKVVASM